MMLEKELRQRELASEFTYPAIGPGVPPVPLPVSPNLDCCGVNRDPLMSGYVSVYKYKPLYECDFQFYQFFHLKSSSPAERTDFYQSLEQSSQDVVQNIRNISDKALIRPTSQEKHRASTLSGLEAVKPTLTDSNGSAAKPCLHGDPLGSPAAKPLPFSVEALLKA